MMQQKHISKIQYISPQYKEESFFDDLQSVINAGVNWIQIRLKDIEYNKWLDVATQSVALCKKQNIVCIINDNPALALESDADGVHLGKNDMSPVDARKIIGQNKIIGGTANTFNDIKNLTLQGVDYIGLGPFRFTVTKKNLSPILGLEGYNSILEQCRNEGITIPIVAIGGILLEDVKEISATGIYGFAFSGLISTAVDKKSLMLDLKKTIG